MKYYAGIGSRRTPPEILLLISHIATRFAQAGWTLRSGSAPGADTYFEDGCDRGMGLKQIFIPWRGFAGRIPNGKTVFAGAMPEAFEIAAQFHPAWERCSPAAQKLHARNSHQILGPSLTEPVDLVVCWTPGGTGTGGTGQALRIARDRGIKIHDLGLERVREEYERRLA